MRIDSIAVLMSTMAELWPVTFPDAKRVSIWTPQYQAVLGHLDGDELNTAYHRCMDGWRKKAAPQPADILKYSVLRIGSKAGAVNGNGETLQEIFKKRDDALIEEKRRLVAEWLAVHPATVSAATQEGWMPNLMHQLAIGANILAQRNMIRLRGIQPRFMPPEDAEYFGIMFEGDEEKLMPRRAMIDLWRSYRSLPPVGGANNFPHVEFAA